MHATAIYDAFPAQFEKNKNGFDFHGPCAAVPQSQILTNSQYTTTHTSGRNASLPASCTSASGASSPRCVPHPFAHLYLLTPATVPDLQGNFCDASIRLRALTQ